MTDQDFMIAIMRLKRADISNPLLLSEDDWYQLRKIMEKHATDTTDAPLPFARERHYRLHFLFMDEPVFIDPDLPNLYSPGS